MIKNIKLNCGVTLVTEQIPYVQSVSIGIWVRAGAVDETHKISGISHLIEHMMFKGTENRSAKAIAADVDKIGGQINAFTGKEATCYYIKTLASNAGKASEILLDMILNSKFDRTEMNKEKQVICEEIKMIQDSPDDDAHDTMLELVFKGDPLAKSIIGTPTSLKGISRNTVKKYIEDEYTKDSIVISVAGSFDENEITELFDGKLKSLKPSKGKKQFECEPYETGFRVKVKDIEQSHICMATRGVRLEDPGYFSFSLLNNILGGSMSSRLFQNIREEKGLAYSVYSVFGAYCDTGYFNIYAGVSHNKIREAISGIKEELAILKKEGITAEELSTAKEQVKSMYIFGQENVNGRMFSIGKNMTLLNKIHSPEEILKCYDKVDMDDIRTAIERIVDIDKYCGVAVTNKRIPLKSYIKG